MEIVVGIIIGMLLVIGITQLLKGDTIEKNYKLVRVERGEWDIYTDFGKKSKYCTFEIYYNPNLDHYKLIYSGYKSNEHSLYFELQNEIIKLNRK